MGVGVNPADDVKKDQTGAKNGESHHISHVTIKHGVDDEKGEAGEREEEGEGVEHGG